MEIYGNLNGNIELISFESILFVHELPMKRMHYLFKLTESLSFWPLARRTSQITAATN